MARFAYFSQHALARISQRTQLDVFVIAEMLDFGLAVDIGNEIIFERKHWLFYSSPDDCCYVAIQDSFTGLVVTILPIDYHENIAWKISNEQLEEAQQLSFQDISHLVNRREKTAPSVIILKAHYLCERNYLKTNTIAKIKVADYNGELLNFINDSGFDREVELHCKEKCIDPFSVSQLSIALGKNGEPLRIDWAPSRAC